MSAFFPISTGSGLIARAQGSAPCFMVGSAGMINHLADAAGASGDEAFKAVTAETLSEVVALTADDCRRLAGIEACVTWLDQPEAEKRLRIRGEAYNRLIQAACLDDGAPLLSRLLPITDGDGIQLKVQVSEVGLKALGALKRNRKPVPAEKVNPEHWMTVEALADGLGYSEQFILSRLEHLGLADVEFPMPGIAIAVLEEGSSKPTLRYSQGVVDMLWPLLGGDDGEV